MYVRRACLRVSVVIWVCMSLQIGFVIFCTLRNLSTTIVVLVYVSLMCHFFHAPIGDESLCIWLCTKNFGLTKNTAELAYHWSTDNVPWTNMMLFLYFDSWVRCITIMMATFICFDIWLRCITNPDNNIYSTIHIR